MIVDVHVHTPTQVETVEEPVLSPPGYRADRQYKRNIGWAEFQEAMKPVDKLIMLGVAHGSDTHNDDIARWAAMWPGKIVPFCALDPSDPGAMEELERCVEDLGMVGIKVSPHYQNWDPMDPRGCAVYAKAERLGLPIAFHQATSPVHEAPLSYAHPMALDAVARAYPDLKVVVAHFGHPWQPDTIALIRKHPNVYTDISAQFYRPWQYYNALTLCMEYAQLHKVLFGTDFPVTTPQETIDTLRSVNDIVEGTNLPRIPEEEIEGIIHRDALALLGIEM
ncbi:MAG: amidohydrolase family protein [Chloroflexota bacterium]|nr:amidohydrolase family protein [Chloroflexota bacterium]